MTAGLADEPELDREVPQREEPGTTDPGLLATLRSLGDQFGPLGVALAAAGLTDPEVLIDRLRESVPFGAPTPDGSQPSAETAGAEPRLPEGIWARVEMPGWCQHTGWVTSETQFGAQVAVIRDWDGNVEAMVGIGPGCRVQPLPTPLRRPEAPERAAITGPTGYVRDCGCSDTEVCEDCEPGIGGPF